MLRGFWHTLFAMAVVFSGTVAGQSINSGTVTGTVLDPTQMAVPKAAVELAEPGDWLHANGRNRRYGHIPAQQRPAKHVSNLDHGLGLRRPAPAARDPGPGACQLELHAPDGRGHHDGGRRRHVGADRHRSFRAHRRRLGHFSKLPTFDASAGLSSIINNSTGGTAADANGFFHPLGDHAQVSFVIDGQPISDQQSKVFSTQLPPDAIQSMQLITGAPDAQYGDKSSLVVNAMTKSGVGARPFGQHRKLLGIVRNLRRKRHLRVGQRKTG